MAPITFPADVSAVADWSTLSVRISVVIALIGAVIAFWRPAFVFLPAAVLLQQKSIAAELFDIRISHTDYIPVLEMALFLGISLMLLGGGLSARLGPITRLVKRCDIQWAMVLIFMTSVAAHFSNYFYSGLQKMLLEGGPWLWLTTNPTHVLSANTWISGHFPLGAWPETGAAALKSVEFLVPVLNGLTLFGQLCALIFVARRITLIGLTLFFDITHIVIYLASGIMFWKWVILNTALVAAMKYLSRDSERPTSVILSIVIVLTAPEVFHIVRLGWYDTHSLTRTEIIAVTKDGSQLIVPTNYFGVVSVTAAQHRLGRPSPGHFPMVTFGTTQTIDYFQRAEDDCSFGANEVWKFQKDPEWLTHFIQLTHTYAIQNANEDGLYRYDFYPHHIWSNPFMHTDFAAIAPSDIETYVYRTVSSCITIEDGFPKEEVRFLDEIVVDALALDRE